MSSRGSEYVVYLLIGGPILLMGGLRAWVKKRLIENTPTSKVRSAAIGFVELAGLAYTSKVQQSPHSKTPCCWWDYEIQELRRSGKNSHWVTVSRGDCGALFYLEDLTGKVLVNPYGAEMRVLTHTIKLGFETRAIERVIPDGAPLHIMGELSSFQPEGNVPQETFRDRLRRLKSDPTQMAPADLNKDGQIDGTEWDSFKAKQEQIYLQEQMRSDKPVAAEPALLISAPREQPYLISTGLEDGVLGPLRWIAPLSVLGGITASCFGVWMALQLGWAPYAILGLVAIGIVVGMIFKKLELFKGTKIFG